MKRSRSFALALLVLAVSHVGAAAQDSTRIAAIQALSVGQHVRLAVSQVGRVKGRFVFANETGLTLDDQNLSTQIRLPDVERLWVRGRATGKGALIGAGVGAVVGALYGFLISTVACDPYDGGDCTALGLGALTGALGGAGGAVLGAGVGFAIPVWHQRFP